MEKPKIKLTEKDKQKFWMEAGGRITIQYLAREGILDHESIAMAIQEWIKEDVVDGEGNKFLD